MAGSISVPRSMQRMAIVPGETLNVVALCGENEDELTERKRNFKDHVEEKRSEFRNLR